MPAGIGYSKKTIPAGKLKEIESEARVSGQLAAEESGGYKEGKGVFKPRRSKDKMAHPPHTLESIPKKKVKM